MEGRIVEHVPAAIVTSVLVAAVALVKLIELLLVEVLGAALGAYLN